MKNLLLASLLVLVGCTTTAPSQLFRGAAHVGDAWEISGDYNELSKNIIIRVNGQNAIDGNLPLFGNSGEVRGSYGRENITANCTQVTKMFSAYLQCIVFVGNERAATLQF